MVIFKISGNLMSTRVPTLIKYEIFAKYVLISKIFKNMYLHPNM